MTRLNTTLLTELIDLLTPVMKNERQRRALLTVALPGASVTDAIDYSGPTQTFVPLLVSQLANYGETEPGTQALWAVLDTVKGMAGVDKQRRIDALHEVVNAPASTGDSVQEINTRFAEALREGRVIIAQISNSPGAQQIIGDGNTQIQTGDVKGKMVNIGGTMNVGDEHDE